MISTPTASSATLWRAQVPIVLDRLWLLLVNPWLQRAILAAAIVWAFWDGIFAGVPRSDHLAYLHHISQFDSLWDILSHSLSFNRTLPDIGTDAILYRPMLYLLLGTFYYLFRYNFVAWQIAGLCLHILVALGLHLLLIQGRLKHTLYPLVITLLFATAYLASELVLWNHIVGYVLFCALEVYAVYFFLRYLRSDRIAFLILCGALSLVAEFTYEAGAMVNLLLAATLLARSFSTSAANGAPAESRHTTDRRSALLFLLAALLLPTASLIDLYARGLKSAPLLHGMDAWRMLLLAGEAALRQLGFWLSAWLAPTVYTVFAAGRAVCLVSAAGLTSLTLLNLVALALLLAAGAAAARRLRYSSVSKREPEFALALCMLFLFGYSMMIAIGRTVERGFEYVTSNTYYSYFAYLTACVAIALAVAVGPTRAAALAIDGRPDPHAGNPDARPIRTARPSWVGAGLFAALTVLVIANALGVRALARKFRYDFAAPRQEVVDHVLAWHAHVGFRTQRYFVVSPTCPGNELLVWFTEARMRKNSGWRPPVTFADALWPDWSANLNAARIYIPRGSVDEIRCDKP